MHGPEPPAAGRLVALVSAAHFVSHFYILVLPPVFALVRADFAVSYTELGLALTAFNTVTAALQTPAGFLVDRISPRAVLVGGLLLGAAALGLAGMVESFWLFVALYGVLGLANTVYHPADYALLSRLPVERLGRAFSIHTFAGLFGSAIAPATMLVLAQAFGWRGAFYASSAVGLAVAALLLVAGASLAAPTKRAAEPHAPPAGDWRVLLAPAILVNLFFYIALAIGNGGVQNYAVVALGALYGTPLALANTALTAYLGLAALGVLIGGFVAQRVPRHDAVAVIGLATQALAIGAVALIDTGAALLVALLALAGLAHGLIMPSRDMLVRAVTPPGAFGRVFGFVTTGFNLGGMVAPLVFGWLMDRGNPRAVLIAAGASAGVAILTLVLRPRPRREPA
jgi:FSR family fosmidomycin resistance protein-like MFS transporter